MSVADPLKTGTNLRFMRLYCLLDVIKLHRYHLALSMQLDIQNMLIDTDVEIAKKIEIEIMKKNGILYYDIFQNLQQ